MPSAGEHGRAYVEAVRARLVPAERADGFAQQADAEVDEHRADHAEEDRVGQRAGQVARRPPRPPSRAAPSKRTGAS